MHEIHHFGSSTVAKVNLEHGLDGLLEDSLLESDTVIIKPNFVDPAVGASTEVRVLQMILENIDAKIFVVEGYQIFRLEQEITESLGFEVDGNVVNWKWLRETGWSWLEKNPNWDWFTEYGYLERIREHDQYFFDNHGFTELFDEFGVEFVNVTEEIWGGRTVESSIIKNEVEEKHEPVEYTQVYDFVPKKIYDLKGSTFVSLSKLKNYATFTLKNTFGLIPDPIRAWWHGPKNCRFDQSVIDINKVYHALFNMYGVCEALYETRRKKSTTGFEFDLVSGPEIFATGRDLVSLDTLLCEVFGFSLTDASYLEESGKIFGSDTELSLHGAKDLLPEWSSLNESG